MARVAFMTAAILKEDWEHPGNEGFVKRIGAAVQTLEGSDGFIASDFDESPVWGELIVPGVLVRPEFQNKYAYTLSLWQDLESVFAYAYHAAHGEALRHRSEWFVKADWPLHIAWWVADDHIPIWPEAIERFEQLSLKGPTAAAFNFQHAYDAAGNPYTIDRERVRAKAARLPAIDWREMGGNSDEE